MATCAFCPESLDADHPDTYHQVTSWVNGPKLDGPVLREQTGVLAHKSCIDNLIHGQAPDQPGLFDDETSSMGGNRSDDCECGFSPHREWCPARRDSASD